MAVTWKEYQEEAASFFRSLGLEAATDVTMSGVRTTHDVDVVVKSHYVGFEVTWLIECKHWRSRVSKLHVLALREIVSDVGADRGILLSEAGFQSGAIEAANLTNVRVTSLAEISVTASNDVYAMRLRELYDRVERCGERYWDIPKDKRIDHDLRPDVDGGGYSGVRVIDMCKEVLSHAFRGVYPFSVDTILVFLVRDLERELGSAEDVVVTLEPYIAELEERLDAYDLSQEKSA